MWIWELYTRLSQTLYGSNYSYYIVRRRLGIWIPVKQDRPWENSPDMNALLNVLNAILKRSKKFIELLIAAIMGLIAIATIAAVAGIALHQTVQTTHFVQKWHENASAAWGSQTHIDEEINERLVDLESAVLNLEELQIMRLQLHLKCDWNVTSFCVIPYVYNQTAIALEAVFRHLKGHKDNLTLDIKELQAKVTGMQHAALELLPATDTLEGIALGLQSLTPIHWIKNWGWGGY